MKEKLREKRKNGHDNSDGHDGAEGDVEDWTGLSTNEHEQLARQRAEEMNEANKLLVSEKWSLDRALLLHGEPHDGHPRAIIRAHLVRLVAIEHNHMLKGIVHRGVAGS